MYVQITKILNNDTNRIFAIPFKAMYIFLRGIYSLKNNSAVYCQVFLAEVQCLQNQCIFALVFCYSISNNLPREKLQ